jgi:hypothetical protein
MAQTLDGKYRPNDADSYAVDIGIYRHAIGNYNFTDDTGAQGAYTIFTTTGDIFIFQMWGLCKVALTSGGAPTIELGIAGNTAAFIAQTAGLDLDQYETWQDNAPDANPAVITLLGRSWTLQNGADAILTIGTADGCPYQMMGHW